MSEADWIRRRHVPTRASALAHFVVFGDVPEEIEASASRHHVGSLPESYDVVKVRRGRSGFLDVRNLVPTAMHVDAGFEAAASCDAQIVIRAELADRGDLLELRSLIGLTTAIAEHPAARAVLDSQIFAIRTPAAWRAEVFDADAPRQSRHVLLMRSDEEHGAWLHTRGLRKFARPDLSILALAEDEVELATEIIRRFAEMQIDGAVIDDGAEVRIRGWPPGWRCRHAGDADDPDFNNSHVDIARPYASSK